MKKEDVFLRSIGNTKPLKNKKTTKFKENKKMNDIQILKTPLKKIENSNSPKVNNKLRPEINSHINKKYKKIDFKVDFHGMNLNEAKDCFLQTIQNCQLLKKRNILFITGKGMRNTKNHEMPKLYYGKIKNELRHWVEESAVSNKILSVSPAPTNLGGEGACIVVLRKSKN
ncbi:MAG: hypothetical protein CFH19_00212 [Alphaproteobacteria bacterium MarineAlpha5_Bin9]|nr:MAG: hypothetical protein CFH19_00212 [Alphaproteobacteria bacterium MarineAlpha5_Bin9]|tara:strand:- start:3995 stop:4507 length:513 start_codon:yes stop_codon:yes gene_type:complete